MDNTKFCKNSSKHPNVPRRSRHNMRCHLPKYRKRILDGRKPLDKGPGKSILFFDSFCVHLRICMFTQGETCYCTFGWYARKTTPSVEIRDDRRAQEQAQSGKWRVKRNLGEWVSGKERQLFRNGIGSEGLSYAVQTNLFWTKGGREGLEILKRRAGLKPLPRPTKICRFFLCWAPCIWNFACV